MDIDFVLWDHDGVLVETEPWFFEATRRTLHDFGVRLSEDHWLNCQAEGRGLAHVVATSGSTEVELGEVRRLRDDLYDQLLIDNEVVIEGALDVLGRVGEHFRMALVTTSLRRFVDRLHAGSSVLAHFDHVITSEDCVRHKPHPEPYLRAMELLGASAARSVAVEDSPRGLTSAVAAGLRCFVVRSPFMARYEFGGAHAILDGIHELPSRLTASPTVE